MVSRSEGLSFISTFSANTSKSSALDGDKKKKSGLKALYKKLKPTSSKPKEQDKTAELDAIRLEVTELHEQYDKAESQLNETSLQREQLQLERDNLEEERERLSYSLEVATSRWVPFFPAPWLCPGSSAWQQQGTRRLPGDAHIMTSV